MKALRKTNFKRQPGKNSPTKPTISNSVLRNNRTEHFQTPREIKSQPVVHLVLTCSLKIVTRTEKHYYETHCKHQSIKTKNEQNLNNFAMGATN